MCYENSNFRNTLASAGVRLMCTKGRQHSLTALSSYSDLRMTSSLCKSPAKDNPSIAFGFGSSDALTIFPGPTICRLYISEYVLGGCHGRAFFEHSCKIIEIVKAHHESNFRNWNVAS